MEDTDFSTPKECMSRQQDRRRAAAQMLAGSGDATSENKEDRSRDIKEIYMIVVDVFPVRVFNNSRGCGWRRRVSLSE